MDASQVALAAVAASITGPLLLAWLTNKQRRQERKEDWDRQDQVAKQAAEAARLLEARQDETERQNRQVAESLIVSNEEVRTEALRTHLATQAQLNQIHTLVNSDLTEAQRRERDATQATLDAVLEGIEYKRRHGLDPESETIARVEDMRKRIETMTTALLNKDRQTTEASEQREEDDQDNKEENGEGSP